MEKVKKGTEKLISTREYHASPRLTHDFKLGLKKRVKIFFMNRDFVEFMESTLKKLPAKDKIACLYYFMKLAKQTMRVPDAEWLKANEDLYLEKMAELKDEQIHFEPVKWIKAELEYLQNTTPLLTKEDVGRELNILQEAKQRLSKSWLTKEEVMELFDISESTLGRWVYDDAMPCRKRGKFTYWFKDEIDEWMKKEIT
ncbi:helix-turn-helix domain-containing protein [Mucilaginibacter sp. CAU 1740]|uniref:helix-turn-helix domain-containing protein n=1 Tax=Mucilaginibacter sp. CAU 1740 TaxID=3140365 RepID=UPI00325C0A6D